MNVVLINPSCPNNKRKIMGSVIGATLDMPPLGLLYIATMLKKNNCDVDVYDFNLYSTEEEKKTIINEIINKKPKLIGFSVSTPCYNNAVKLSECFRNELSDKECKIVWGGYHVTFLPEKPLKEGLANIVIRGEGEQVFLELALLIKKGKYNDKNLEKLNGVSFVKKNKIIHNSPDILRICDLDSIPFPNRNLISINDYTVPGTIMGSRGCMGQCQFCAAGAWGEIRVRSPQNIVDELVWIKKNYNFDHICFIDNTFIVNKKRTEKIVNLIKKEDLDFTYSLETRVSNVNEEIIKKLKEIDIIAIQFGVETGSQNVMDRIKKNITIPNVYEAVKMCLKHDIKVMCTFIIGFPYDTYNTTKETIKVAKNIKRYGGQVKFEMLTPYPGTEIFNKREEFGLKIIDWDYNKWGSSEPVFYTSNLTKKELSQLFMNSVMEVSTI